MEIFLQHFKLVKTAVTLSPLLKVHWPPPLLADEVNTGPTAIVAAGTTVPASVMDTGNDITITNNVTGATAVTTAAAGDTAKQRRRRSMPLQDYWCDSNCV